MKRIFTFTTFIIVLFCSCSDSNNIINSPNEQYCIDFTTSITAMSTTKGTPLFPDSELLNMGVFCKADYTIPTKNLTKSKSTIMNNCLWENQQNEWTTDTPVYWDSHDYMHLNYSFTAYTPYASQDNGISISEDKENVHNIHYSVPADIRRQPDLMLATARNISPSNNAVHLQFRHALCCLTFKTKGSGETINSISIEGISTEGTVSTDATGNIVWSHLGKPNTCFTVNMKDENTTAGNDAEEIIDTDGYLMMIPQNLPETAKINITIDGKIFTYPLASSVKKDWQAGEYITYLIDTDKIIPEIIVDYTDKKRSNCYIVNTTQNKRLTYHIPVNRVNQFWNSEGNIYQSNCPDYTIKEDTPWTVGLLWQDSPNMVVRPNRPNEGIVIKKNKGVGPDDYFSISVPKHFNMQGNFVIGITIGDEEPDIENLKIPIVWSWHFWLTDYNPYTEATAIQAADDSNDTWAWQVPGGYLHEYPNSNGCKVMDRNIGEISNTTERGIFHYQYGRKDPFPAKGPLYQYGNKEIKYNEEANLLFGYSLPVVYTVHNPLSYVISKNPDDLWCASAFCERQDIVWNDPAALSGSGNKSIFDPSPWGFKLPEQDLWDSFNGESVQWNNGYLEYTRKSKDFSCAARYSANSLRPANGAVISEEYNDYLFYFTGTPASDCTAYGLSCTEDISITNEICRNHACNLRCVEDKD